MKILGIETSCDETAAAVVENGITLLANVIATSADMHAKTGGVIPEEAARQQLVSIIPVIQETLKESHLSEKDIDALAVTVGPGLIGSLLVGVETAKTLSLAWDKPLIPVNHLVGHIYGNWLITTSLPLFPALALVVSGGHTDLVIMENHHKMDWIGGTRDDAAGEAFDKTARLLNLPYPGGPNLSKLAQTFLAKNNKPLNLFPRPLLGEDNFDWSFSGLKTAVLRETQRNSIISNAEMAAQIQEAIVDSLIEKIFRALEKFQPKSFLLSGGVAANARLREKIVNEFKNRKLSLAFHVPEPKLCTDNAAYIASAAYFAFKQKPWREITANPNLAITDIQV